MGFCVSKCVTYPEEVYDPYSEQQKRIYNTSNIERIQRNISSDNIKISTNNEHICTICLCDNEGDNILESFCDCKGSVEWMHRKCLIQWIETSGNKTCKVCNKLFNIYKPYKPNVDKLNKTNIYPSHELDNLPNITERRRNNRRIYNQNLRNRNVEEVIERIGYDPIIQLPGSINN